MPPFKTLNDGDFAGRRVLVRADLNLPLNEGRVTDRMRLDRLMPTLRRLTEAGAKVILMSHLGRPEGRPAAHLSLAPVAAVLRTWVEDELNRRFVFVSDCIGEVAEATVAAMADGDVALLENLRFHPGEEANDPDFLKGLARLGDAYVNDAFSCAHRVHASTAGIARLLPAFAGPAMEAELEALKRALGSPARPLAAVVGGAKVSTKLAVLEHLVDRVDLLIVGGGMANTFLLADGVRIGRSLAEPDLVETARRVAARAQAGSCRILLPEDAVVAERLESGVAIATVALDRVPAEHMILDVGPRTTAAILSALEDCATLLWNGPLGAFEVPPFDQGTVAAAQATARLTRERGLVSVAGGGDTVAALNHAGVADDFTYVSAAGGAFLEWLEGRTLPGVAALET